MLGQRHKHLKFSRHCQTDKASIVVQFVDFLEVENATGHLEGRGLARRVSANNKKWSFILGALMRALPSCLQGLRHLLSVKINPGEIRGMNYQSGKYRNHQLSEFQER